LWIVNVTSTPTLQYIVTVRALQSHPTSAVENLHFLKEEANYRYRFNPTERWPLPSAPKASRIHSITSHVAGILDMKLDETVKTDVIMNLFTNSA